MASDTKLAFGNTGIAARDCRPTPICESRPVCPACGGPECLCRPRFFAGQLLTEEDLNGLDRYIVGKNRLHNRHLFGTGVVCGLNVICTPCDPVANGKVIVEPGYALSPCGNDIVVCKAESVDVCDLINRCQPKADDCYRPDPDRGGDEGQPTDEWVLAICYQEKPSRGMTPLRGASCSCGGSCGCGGHGKTGCGCGGSSHAHAGSGETGCGCGGGRGSKPARTTAAVKPGPRSAQCEPTLTCESYSFAVYKAPPEDRDRRRDPGALIKRFLCCVVPLFELLPQLPASQPQGPTQQELYNWLTEFITRIREFLMMEGLYSCDAVLALGKVVVPVPGGSNAQYFARWVAAFYQVFDLSWPCSKSASVERSCRRVRRRR